MSRITQGERIMAIETKVAAMPEQLKKIDVRLEKIDDRLDKICDQLADFSKCYVRKDDDATFKIQIEKYKKELLNNANNWVSFGNGILKLIGALAVAGGILWQIKQLLYG